MGNQASELHARLHDGDRGEASPLALPPPTEVFLISDLTELAADKRSYFGALHLDLMVMVRSSCQSAPHIHVPTYDRYCSTCPRLIVRASPIKIGSSSPGMS